MATVPMAVPTVVPVMTPAHLFRLEATGLFDGGHGRMRIHGSPAALFKRVRRQRRGLHARGKCGSSRGQSKTDFQKVTAFHDISLFVIWRVMRGRV
jgi:hypothetical protein